MLAILAILLMGDEERPTPPVLTAPERVPTSNIGHGPLHLGSQSPFRGGLALDVPSTLGAGRWEARESVTWSRVWGQTDDYLLSFETLRRSSSWVYGASDRVRLEIGAAETLRFGGDLDGFVKNFHDAFGLSQGGRDTVEEGEYHFRVGDVDVPADERGREEIFAGVSASLTDGGAWMPAVSAGLRVTRGEDGTDAAISLSAAKGWGAVYAYLAAELAHYGADSLYGLELRERGMSIRAALEWRPLPWAALLLQYQWTSGALRGYGDLSAPAHEVALGVKAELGGGYVLEVGGTENVLVFDNSPDFGLHAGLTGRF